MNITPARYRSNRIIGFRAQWGDDDPDATRGIIVERVIGGTPVRFFISDEGDAIQSFNADGKWYEERELALITQHYGGGTFVDVGANVGNHSLYAALVLKAEKVIAFEPVTHRTCLYNFLLNGLGERAVFHRCGLADKPGRAAISLIEHRNLGATRIAPGEGDIELCRGDDLLKGETIGFIKIDVEAMEMAVLAGLEKTIAAQRPPMMVEVDPANREAVGAFVKRHRYRVAARTPIYRSENVLLVPK